MVKLIFVNLYGTILPENGKPILRDGFLEFLDRYKHIRFAISTYASKEVAIPDLISVGLISKVEQIYTQESMHYIRIYNKGRNDLNDAYP